MLGFLIKLVKQASEPPQVLKNGIARTMKLSAALVLLSSALVAFGSPVPAPQRREVSQSAYDDLVWYFKYASSAYWSDSCEKPNGKTLVSKINQASTHTQGYIARDDDKKEIIIALRGSSSIFDFLVTDASLILKDFFSPGAAPPAGTKTHTGFTDAWNSIAAQVIAGVKAELAAHPGYSVITSGHSLGGSLSSLAAATLKGNFPDTPIRMYTFGQPRTGNPTYASWVNNVVGVNNIFRVVHTTDGIPAIIPQILGYKHHATEYYQEHDPAKATNINQCDASGEDPKCSNGSFVKGIIGHTNYFNHIVITPFCS